LTKKSNTLRISPLPSVRAKKFPIALLNGEGKREGEKHAKIIYCNSAAPALRIVREQGGQALISRTRGSTRWIKFHVGYADIFPGVFCGDIEQIIAWRDFAYEHGISARSIQSMAFYLMRQSLAGYFDVSKGGTIPFNYFPSGPRMQARPGVWNNVHQADISSAYLWGIGRFSPTEEFSIVNHFRLYDVAQNPGSWAIISFRCKEKSWGPLPLISEQGTTYFPGRDYGWSPPVLVSSFDLDGNHRGADIRKIRAWIAGKKVYQPFLPFMLEISRLRKQGNFPDIAKQAGNTLWGNFCSSSNMELVTFPGDGKPGRITKLSKRDALCLPIGYSVSAKLRARLFSVTDHPSVVQAHTDGFMTTSIRDSLPIGHPSKLPQDAEPGEWRNTGKYREVEILSPSWYRTVDFEGNEQYKIAGRSYRSGDRTAEAIFRNQRGRIIRDGS
jgi:hypothetical protein